MVVDVIRVMKNQLMRDTGFCQWDDKRMNNLTEINHCVLRTNVNHNKQNCRCFFYIKSKQQLPQVSRF